MYTNLCINLHKCYITQSIVYLSLYNSKATILIGASKIQKPKNPKS